MRHGVGLRRAQQREALALPPLEGATARVRREGRRLGPDRLCRNAHTLPASTQWPSGCTVRTLTKSVPDAGGSHPNDRDRPEPEVPGWLTGNEGQETPARGRSVRSPSPHGDGTSLCQSPWRRRVPWHRLALQGQGRGWRYGGRGQACTAKPAPLGWDKDYPRVTRPEPTWRRELRKTGGHGEGGGQLALPEGGRGVGLGLAQEREALALAPPDGADGGVG